MKKRNIKTLKRCLKLIKENKMSFMYVLFIIQAIGFMLITVVGVFYSKLIVDAITKGLEIKDLIIRVCILTGINVISIISALIARAKLESAFFKLRTIEFVKSSKLYHDIDFKLLEDQQFVEKMNIASETTAGDGQGFQHVYDNLMSITANICTIICFVVILSIYNYLFMFLILFLIIVTAFVNNRIAKYSFKRNNDTAHTFRQKNYFSNLTEDFNYGKDIRVFSLKERINNKFKDKSLSYIKVLVDLANNRFLYGLLGLIALLIEDGLAYFLIIKAYFNGNIDLGIVTLMLTTVVSLSEVIRECLNNISSLNEDLRMTTIYFDTMDYYGSINENKGLNSLTTESLEIEFKNVSFKYPNTDRYVIKNLNFKINKGEKLAIVGENGSGKSTIVKLISGLYYPNEGEILVNGIPSTAFKKSEYYKMFSTVFQDYEIYGVSVLENVLGKEEDVIKAKKAIEVAGIKDVIEKMPKGYDTILNKVIDENGVDMSGGERQRLAIARALYKDAPAVILDEPTAALDALAEAKIYESLDELVKNKTAIYISHRLSSTKFCDHIAFFDSTGLKEYGNHDSLMKLGGLYHDMFILQGKYYQKGEDINEK